MKLYSKISKQVNIWLELIYFNLTHSGLASSDVQKQSSHLAQGLSKLTVVISGCLENSRSMANISTSMPNIFSSGTS